MGDYAGPLRAMVLGHKEHHLWALTGALGDLLEDVIAAAVPLDRPVLLVPVPSRAAAVRQRGHDATRAMVQAAARRLRRRGVAVAVAPVLRLRPGVLDQAGLDAAGRASNLHRSMWVPPQALRRAARLARPGRVVLCDDVLTTGATAREGQRALEGVGLLLSAIATVAATRRRVAADL
jgi:predicted amidophosphoribosyltransferase